MRIVLAVIAVTAAAALVPVLSTATPASFDVACAGKDYKGS